MKKYEFDKPEKVDEKLSKLVADDLTERVKDNLSKRDIKI